MVTFLGLHADESTQHPTFISELRRRIFARIFIIDEVVVAFQGRPPLLSYRHVTTPPPLEIPDEDFQGSHEAFQRAVAKLDESGWSPTNEIWGSTLTRARFKLAYIRGELMDAAVSGNKLAHPEVPIL
jgi:hypothetical protein